MSEPTPLPSLTVTSSHGLPAWGTTRIPVTSPTIWIRRRVGSSTMRTRSPVAVPAKRLASRSRSSSSVGAWRPTLAGGGGGADGGGADGDGDGVAVAGRSTRGGGGAAPSSASAPTWKFSEPTLESVRVARLEVSISSNVALSDVSGFSE